MTADRRRIWIASALVFALVVAVFARAIGNGFVSYDDPDYVIDNPIVNGGLTWDGVVAAFTRSHAANWHPLTWISHMIDVELVGLDPRGHHAIGVALHALTAALLCAVLASLTRAPWPSAAAAALWAVHPTRVESVAWVAERKDVLAALLWIVATACWARWIARRKLASYLLAAAVFAGALLAKPTAVTWPVVMLALDWWPFRRLIGAPPVAWRRAIVEKLPLLALSIAASIATVIAQRAGSAVVDTETVTLGARLANVPVAYASYLRQVVWPLDLAVFYPHPLGDVSIARVAASSALIVALSALAIAWRSKLPELLAGWAWFLIALVPMIGIVQVGGQAYADRYGYIPHVGLWIAIAFAGARAAPPVRRALAAVAVLALVTFAALAYRQIATWRNGETLFRRALAVTEGNYIAMNGLAYNLIEDGRAAEAVPLLRDATGRWRDFRKAQANLMRALAESGALDEARAVERDWLQRFPDDLAMRLVVPNALFTRGDVDGAIDALKRVLATTPAWADAQHRLGELLLVDDRPAEAISPLQLAAAIAPRAEVFRADAQAVAELAAGVVTRTSEDLRRRVAALHRELARSLERGGETARAEEHRSRADALEQ